jgi:hypothetical protein
MITTIENNDTIPLRTPHYAFAEHYSDLDNVLVHDKMKSLLILESARWEKLANNFARGFVVSKGRFCNDVFSLSEIC